MKKLLLLIVFASCVLIAADIAVSTTPQERESVLKLSVALAAKNAEMSQATIQLQQAELQYTQQMDEKKQEAQKLQNNYNAAVEVLKEKCTAAKIGFDEKTLDCVAVRVEKEPPR